MADLLELILITVHDSNSQDELLCIVVIENAVQVISKTLKKTQYKTECNFIAKH